MALSMDILRALAVDSGSTTTVVFAGGGIVVDASKSWQTDIHKNRLIRIIQGHDVTQTAVILSNTSNTITIRGTFPQAIFVGTEYVIHNADYTQILRDVLGGGRDISATNPLRTFDPKVVEVDTKMGSSTDPAGTTTFFAWFARVWGSLFSSQGLYYQGIVTAAAAPSFTIASLAGLGTGKFSDAQAPYWAFVSRDAGGAGAIPQGQMRVITAYNTVTGQFTTAAFGAAVDVGDEVMILHPRIADFVVPVSGVHAHANDVLEQLVLTTVTALAKIETIYLDLVNLTQNCTIRVYHQIDGANYRVIETFNWTTGMSDGVYFRDIAVDAPVQVTVQSAALEGAVRNIPWKYLYRE